MVIQLYADGADLAQMQAIHSRVNGFTTNPALMRKAGITDYASFGKAAIKMLEANTAVMVKPISLEVFADDFNEMQRQARIIASWGENVYVKIPITNTKGESSAPLIKELSADGVKVNVTAVFSYNQIIDAVEALSGPSILSIFAGRIADTGRDPVPIVHFAKALACRKPIDILWASTRELLNIKQAEGICDIITVPNDMIAKLHLFGKDLEQYSLETVAMFYNDAKASGFSL